MEYEKKIFIPIFLLFSLFSFSLQDLSSCSYPLTKRLISGNYLLICSNSINFYDSTLQNNITGISTPSCTGSCMYYTVSAQFLKEDGEFIIVSKNYCIYIFSKSGIFLSSITISYLSSSKYYSIVPYGHSNYFYYFSLMYINSNSIKFQKYEFNSLNNITSELEVASFLTNIYPENAISCSLMKFTNKNVITCFYGENYLYICTVFDPYNNFQYIQSNNSTISTNGGTHYKSEVMPESMQKAVCCRGIDTYFCVSYDISQNILSNVTRLNNNWCIDPNYFSIKYIFETKAFFIGCYEENNYFNIGMYSQDLKYTFIGRLSNVLPSECSNTKIDFIYSSVEEKYSILTGSTCKNITHFQNINGTKIQEFPINCDYYIYDNNCYDEIPEGYYINDITHMILGKCHSDCNTCIKDISGNSICLSCKDNKYLHLGN